MKILPLWEIRKLPYGSIRRKQLIGWVKYQIITNGYLSNGIPINQQHQFQDNDPDLRYLIKKGILKRIRFGTRKCKQTYLILNHETNISC